MSRISYCGNGCHRTCVECMDIEHCNGCLPTIEAGGGTCPVCLRVFDEHGFMTSQSKIPPEALESIAAYQPKYHAHLRSLYEKDQARLAQERLAKTG